MKVEKRRSALNKYWASGQSKVALIGGPNVGKSVIFYELTGIYGLVANYPGTTVEVMRGSGFFYGHNVEIIDTPGMYSLIPTSQEEEVTRQILVQEKPEVIIHVVDARNLPRMLNLTLELLEWELSVVLVVNMLDEAEKQGIEINLKKLSQSLGIAVIGTVATTGKGIEEIKSTLARILGEEGFPQTHITYDRQLEEILEEIGSFLQGNIYPGKRGAALQLMQEDEKSTKMFQVPDNRKIREELLASYREKLGIPLCLFVRLQRQKKVDFLIAGAVESKSEKTFLAENLSRLMIHPLTGLPFLFLVLYLGFYQLVGILGAGYVVDFLDNRIFLGIFNPAMSRLVTDFIPWPAIQELLVGDFGIITMGLRYALAIILPVVAAFFFFFSLLEDTGYLPRLALLLDSLFKRIGLNGQAVIPVVLGLGCDAMATMSTRILSASRERLIVTFLLTLAVPCSAQLGVIAGLLSSMPGALFIWFLFVAGSFLLMGFISAKILPGERLPFCLEVTALRLPSLSNLLFKTWKRIEWYLMEILPLFLGASIIIWVGQLVGIFELLIGVLAPVVSLIGLPAESSVVFIFGFFRRDYGAAGLFDLHARGVILGHELVVAAVTLTLFVPCVVQLAVNIKERGLKAALIMCGIIIPFAFFMGFVANILFELGIFTI